MAQEFDTAGELARALEQLPAKFEKRAVKSAARQAANVFRDAARAKAKTFDDPATGEKLWKQIVVKNGKAREVREAGGAVVHVGVRDLRNYFYWQFLEFGTSTMQAQPFMRPAMDYWPKAIDKFAEQLWPAIEKQLGKM